ncbi:MAG TPA: hypothetical protein VHT29_03280 [Solirubrobacteraceae bacterium]|nr:hypothetical protein [Solirubrobacteraceae bacterium]
MPFSAGELCDLAKMGGGVPLRLNAVLTRARLPQLPVPQVSIWGLDLLAYDLLLPVVRPDPHGSGSTA